MDEIKRRESTNNYTAVNPDNPDATGAHQFLGSTWRDISSQTGVPQYRRAKDAPPWVQDTNALALLRRGGGDPNKAGWAASGPYDVAAITQGAQGSQPGAQQGGGGYAQNLLQRLAGGENIDVTPQMIAQIMNQPLQALQPSPVQPKPAAPLSVVGYEPTPGGPAQQGQPGFFPATGQYDVNLLKNLWGSLVGGSAYGNELLSKVADGADSLAGVIAQATGTQKGGAFGNVRDWFHNQAQQARQYEQQISSGSTDLPSELAHAAGHAIMEGPIWMLAQRLGGIPGVAALGGISESDKGPAAATISAATNALFGGTLEALQPFSAPVRMTGTSALSYLFSKAAGGSNTDALANALMMGGMSAHGDGGVGISDLYPGVGRATAAAADALARTGEAAKGAVTGAWQTGTEPTKLQKFGIGITVPKFVVTGAAGGEAAHLAGLPAPAGAVVGGAVPFVAGAVRGARAGWRGPVEAAAPEAAPAEAPPAATPQQYGGYTPYEGPPPGAPPSAAPEAPGEGPPQPRWQSPYYEPTTGRWTFGTQEAAPPMTPQDLTQLETGRPPSRQGEAAQASAAQTLATAQAAAPQAAQRPTAYMYDAQSGMYRWYDPVEGREVASREPPPGMPPSPGAPPGRDASIMERRNWRLATAGAAAPQAAPEAPAAPAAAPEAPPAAEAPEAPPRPSAAEVAARLEAMTRVDRMTNVVQRLAPDVSPADIDKFEPNDWRMIAQAAGSPEGTVPALEERFQVRQNFQPTNVPAEAEARFQARAGMGRAQAPVETPGEAPPQPAPLPKAPPGVEPAEELARMMPEFAVQPRGPAGPAGPTASETRVEALARELAAGDIPTKDLATIPDKRDAQMWLEEMMRSINEREGTALGRPAPGEIPQIIDRVRQIRNETPGPVDAVRQILNDPDAAANQALDRIRRRRGFDPGQVSNLGPGGENFPDAVIWSAANLVKAAQKIYGGASDFAGWSKQMVADLGEAVRPHLQAIWDRAKPMADVAMRDVKRRSLQDMRIRIPDEQRVVSPDPTQTIDGRPFHDLDLDKSGPGFLPMRARGEDAANQMLQRAWQESIAESEAPGGHSAADAVRETGARPPDAQFWDKSLSLPDRTRYWYELSGESFTGKHFDIPRDMQPALIDTVAATSGGAEPPDNMRRAVGLFAENAQRRPSMVDLRDPVSPRRALDPAVAAIESRKYGSFSGTQQRTSGLTKDNPLPTNDVQVGSMFGITGNDIGKNPILYEVLSRYFMKLRDMQNQGLIDMHQLPSGEWTAAGGKAVQPYESWQMQAPAWVYERARKDPAMSTRYDDYSQVMDRDIIPRLQAAGIATPGGKITMDTLMDPRTPDAMAPTAPHFRATPTATMEVATTLTPQGARAAANYQQLNQLDPSIPWVREAQDKYVRIQRQAMEDLGERYSTVDPETGKKVTNPSPVSQLMSAMTGERMDVSRINTKAAGTYQSVANPNMRIPLTGRTSAGWRSLDNVERDAFLAYLGKWLNQDASAGSHFKVVPEGTGDTYTAFLRTYADKLDIPAIERFARTLGFDVNAEQTPTGVTLDINVGGRDDRPTMAQIEHAMAETFDNDSNVHDWWAADRAYSSNYVPKEGYDEAIATYEQREAAAKRAAKKVVQVSGTPEPGAVAGPRTAFGNVSDIRRVGPQVQAIAKARDTANDAWSTNVESRLQKHLAKAAGQ